MKMKQMILVLCALIIACVVFGTVMFFARKDLKDAAENMKDEESVDVSTRIQEINTEFILMQITVNAEKNYIKTGFLIDKYGNRHYFDITSNEDRTPQEMYEEALKQKDFYETDSFIPQSDTPLLYESIKQINTENEPLESVNTVAKKTDYYYAILSDGIKTYPFLVYASGYNNFEPDDYGAKAVKAYILNITETISEESTFVPVPTEAFASSVEKEVAEENSAQDSGNSTEESPVEAPESGDAVPTEVAPEE